MVCLKIEPALLEGYNMLCPDSQCYAKISLRKVHLCEASPWYFSV